MDPHRWNEVAEILGQAQEIENEAERARFVEHRCSDPSLLAEVNALLDVWKSGASLEETALVPEPTRIPGDVVGPYRIVEEIGRGGMGVVYRAEDTRLQRHVALKFLLDEYKRNPLFLERFRREARAASAANHPNICAVYDVGDFEGQPYIVMELLEGQSLRQRIGDTPLPLDQVLEWGIQVAGALSAAHGQGIIHRDVKPANIFITQHGQAKVLDFGVAKPSHTAPPSDATNTKFDTRAGILVGTMAYMAPEQALGAELDARADVFSLGAVLFEMSTGRKAIDTTSPGISVLDAVLHNDPPAVDALNPSLPREMGEMVLKALQKDRAHRYQSALELQEDLKRLQLGAPPTIAVRARTKPYRLLLAAAVLLACAVSIAWLVHRRTEPASFAPRDWILVADLENQTGDPVFDLSLSAALSLSLEQSRFANVYPGQRVRETLARMQKPAGTRIDESVGREIALRAGVKALIAPSISAAGGGYQLKVRISDPLTGAVLKSEAITVKGRNQILVGLDKLAGRVRAGLGESVPAIDRNSRPLEEVTTPSLEALKQYSIAIAKHGETNMAEARLYYQNALNIDPEFTSARASLGIINFAHFDKEEGRRLLSQAIRRVENVTEREKYHILAYHARAVEENLEKAISYQKLLVERYPDYVIGHNNLAVFYQEMGRCQDSASELEQALRLDDRALLFVNLVINDIDCLGDLDAAIAKCKTRLSKYGPELGIYAFMAYAYLGTGEWKEAERAFESAMRLNALPVTQYNFVLTLLLDRQFPRAMEVLNGMIANNQGECPAYYYMGLAQSLAGDSNAGRKQWIQAAGCYRSFIQSHPERAEENIALAITLTRLGETAAASIAARKARPEPAVPGSKFADADFQFDLARLYTVQGMPDEAMQSLEHAEQLGFKDYVFAKAHPDLQSLSGNPRFLALMRRHIKTERPQ